MFLVMKRFHVICVLYVKMEEVRNNAWLDFGSGFLKLGSCVLGGTWVKSKPDDRKEETNKEE